MRDLTKELILDREALLVRLDTEVLSSTDRNNMMIEIEAYSKFIEKGQYLSLINKKRKSSKLSIKQACIVVFEHELFKEQDREKHDLNIIIELARKRFVFSNKDSSKLGTLKHLHPKRPCRYFEEKGIKKSGYTKSIKYIVENDWWLIDTEEVKSTFKLIYDDLKSC